jgi:Bacterial transcriptional activator domain.
MRTVGEPERTIASVRVLGGVQAVAADGSPIDLPSASQRRLLAILALHSPRRLRSEWLADALDVSPGALRTTVSRVRATVGATVLESGSTGYALVADVDAALFCRAVGEAAAAKDPVPALARALALWNGPPLEEFGGEEWAGGEIARLTEIHAGAVDDLADALIEAHRPANAVALLEGQVASSPYRDRPRGLLIRALASAGRQADALRAFQQYRELLIDEFGTDPSPDVVRIERRVATGWNGVESVRGARATSEFETANDVLELPLPAELKLLGQFVGRTRQLEVLTSELALVTTTGARCVVVGGEAGIGKTTLLVGFAQSLVESGRATMSYGRCDETGVSMQPFRTILSSCVEHASLAMLTEHVARHGGELLRLCPGLALRVPTTPSPTESDDSAERFLAFEAAVDVLRRVAKARPLVMMLDDLQWAEPTALLLLRHLARGLADAPVLLVISSRDPDEHASHALRLAFADLDRGETRRLDLVGFDANELDDLLEGAGSTESDHESGVVVAALQVQTAGNPLYASQLIQHWMETGFTPNSVPPSVRDVIWRRVHALGEDAAEVLTAAAVLGVEFSQDVLLDTVALPEAVVLDALDVAARGGLLIDAGSVRRSYRFTHALVANALVTDLGPARRARLHGLAARALEKSLEVLPPKVVVELARHCALAGWPAEAQHWSTRAGDDARDHLAMAEAVHHYRVALDVAIALDRPAAERADLLVRLGDAQHRSGDAEAFDPSKRAPVSRSSAGRTQCSSAPLWRPTAFSCAVTNEHRSTWRRSKPRSRSRIRPMSQRTRGFARCSPRA